VACVQAAGAKKGTELVRDIDHACKGRKCGVKVNLAG
jgi:hypothetical protein